MAVAVRLSKIDDELADDCTSLTNAGGSKALEECVSLNAPATNEAAKRKPGWEYYLRYVSLVVLVVQNTTQVLLMRYATRREQPQFLKTVAVFFNEVLKLLASTILFIISSGSLANAFSEFKRHFIINFMGTLKVCVPALIYTIQNFLLYVAIEHLDAATYMVTYQLKILTTALFTVLMLKRRLSLIQWLSLCVLIGGVALVQIVKQDSSTSKTSGLECRERQRQGPAGSDKRDQLDYHPRFNYQKQRGQRTCSTKAVGWSSGCSYCVHHVRICGYLLRENSEGIGCVYLAAKHPASRALASDQLDHRCGWRSGLCFYQLFQIKDNERVLNQGLLQGFDLIVWCVVAIQAFGGLVVAIVIKYADNILKAFATSIAIVVSSVASIFFFSVMPKPLFVAGATLVIGSVVLYSIFPPKTLLANVVISDEADTNKDALKGEKKMPFNEKTSQATVVVETEKNSAKNDDIRLDDDTATKQIK